MDKTHCMFIIQYSGRSSSLTHHKHQGCSSNPTLWRSQLSACNAVVQEAKITPSSRAGFSSRWGQLHLAINSMLTLKVLLGHWNLWKQVLGAYISITWITPQAGLTQSPLVSVELRHEVHMYTHTCQHKILSVLILDSIPLMTLLNTALNSIDSPDASNLFKTVLPELKLLPALLSLWTCPLHTEEVARKQPGAEHL